MCKNTRLLRNHTCGLRIFACHYEPALWLSCCCEALVCILRKKWAVDEHYQTVSCWQQSWILDRVEAECNQVGEKRKRTSSARLQSCCENRFVYDGSNEDRVFAIVWEVTRHVRELPPSNPGTHTSTALTPLAGGASNVDYTDQSHPCHCKDASTWQQSLQPPSLPGTKLI